MRLRWMTSCIARIWTCPHVCQKASQPAEGSADPPPTLPEPQPTVSFYTPANAFGGLLDVYMGFENYHMEHHDFPEMPMYHLPKLRSIAPEAYALRSMPILSWSTWRDLWGGEFFYACQDETFGVK